MNTHQFTRTYYAETSAKEMQTSVTLAGPCMAAPTAAPQWTRPVSVEIAYRSVVATKVLPPKSGDKFGAETFTPAQMIAAVKAERTTFHLAPGREKMQGLRCHGKSQKQIEFEERILDAIIGEMTANQIKQVIGSRTAEIATALGRMVDDGRVTRRYHIAAHRQVGLYRRAAILEITEVKP